MKILCADDDKDLLALIAFTLSQAGYLVIKASDGLSAIKAFEAEAPDLVVLDINMPGASGFQVCEAIRTKSRTPVMMLTVRGEEEDLVRALELGADDYLTKPFSPRTLLARVKALLRRAGMENSAPLAAGRVQLDIEEHTVQVGTGSPVRLTKLELRLLQMLIANAGHTVSSDRLLMQVWGHKGSSARAPAAAQDRSRPRNAADAADGAGRGVSAGGGVRVARAVNRPLATGQNSGVVLARLTASRLILSLPSGQLPVDWLTDCPVLQRCHSLRPFHSLSSPA